MTAPFESASRFREDRHPPCETRSDQRLVTRVTHWSERCLCHQDSPPSAIENALVFRVGRGDACLLIKDDGSLDETLTIRFYEDDWSEDIAPGEVTDYEAFIVAFMYTEDEVDIKGKYDHVSDDGSGPVEARARQGSVLTVKGPMNVKLKFFNEIINPVFNDKNP